MASLNKIQLIGHLGNAPELRYLPNGDAVASFSMATSESWKDKTSGEKKEATEWWRITFFGKLAEVAGQYLDKGSQVYIEGRGKTEKWQDKEGQDRYTFKVVGEKMVMLGGKDSQHSEHSSRRSEPAQPKPASSDDYKGGGAFNDVEDDLPF